MQERLLQYIWHQKYFDTRNLFAQTGESIVVQHTGEWNRHQGPDFLDARVLIDGIQWAGHVEIHTRSSHWRQHRHSGDPFYGNVILHVVWNDDDKSLSSVLPTIELQDRVSSCMLGRYQALMEAAGGKEIACSSLVDEVPAGLWESWKEALLLQRLDRKAGDFNTLLKATGNDWEKAGWCWLTRHFGGPVNGDFFEALGKSIDWKWLVRRRQQLARLEAVLLGQARLIPENPADPYVQLLDKEYRAAQRLCAFPAVHGQASRLRMRPASFPDVRLAQLAALVRRHPDLHRQWLTCTNWKDAAALLDITAGVFWDYHYQLDETSPWLPKKLGSDTTVYLLINAVAPMLFAYGQAMDVAACRQTAVHWLWSLPAESNQVVQHWQRLGLPVSQAADSQALLELSKNYCHARKCLDCRVGQHLIGR